MTRLVWVLMMLGCGGGGNSPGDSGVPDDSVTDARICVPDTGPPTIIFLNRGGGTYTPGANDSSTNVSSIVNQSTTLAAPTVDDGDFTTVIACVADLFLPFNVTITGTEPGVAEHHELVLIDSGAQIGQASSFAVSPVMGCNASDQAQPIPKSISFLMWGAFGNTPETNLSRCEVGAQAVAAALGLDHAFSCPDVMTFLADCGAKAFTDAEVPCGEDTARPCNCGGNTQNSYAYLAALLGETCQ